MVTPSIAFIYLFIIELINLKIFSDMVCDWLIEWFLQYTNQTLID